MTSFDIPCSFPKSYLKKIHKQGVACLDDELSTQYIRDCFIQSNGELIPGKVHVDIIIIYPYYTKRLAKIADTNNEMLAPDIDITVDKVYHALEGIAFEHCDCISQMDIAKIHGVNPMIKVTIVSMEEINNGELFKS